MNKVKIHKHLYVLVCMIQATAISVDSLADCKTLILISAVFFAGEFVMHRNCFITIILTLFIFTAKLIIIFSHYYSRQIYSGKQFIIKNNDVILIVGGSNGLGLEIYLCFRKTHRICIVDSQPFDDDYDNKMLTFIQFDISKPNWVDILGEIEQKCGKITILINCAGIKYTQNLLSLEADKIDHIFKVNFFAHISSTKYFIEKRLEDKNHLFVVNIASVLGLISPANLSMYSASKAALIAAHESLFHELRNSGHHQQVRMLLVKLGQLDTHLFEDVNPPRQFFAPVLSHVHVAHLIHQRIIKGEIGELTLPLYGNFVSLMRILPLWLAELLRSFSGIDTAVHTKQQ